MILGAALLVLVALGLFVAGLLTGDNVWYWSCVGTAVVAAVLLFVARRQLAEPEREQAPRRAPARRPAVEDSEDDEDDGDDGDDEARSAGTQEVPQPSRAPEAAAEPGPPPAGEPTPASAAASAPTDGATADTAAVNANGDPPAEDVEVSDLLLVVDMHDDVFVVDEHPRYHLADCSWLAGREAIPFPVDEARTDGFTPCGICRPDRYLAGVARARMGTENP